MALVKRSAILHFLDSVRGRTDLENASDSILLQRYLDQQDHLAFATLLRRHGPMVFRVCQRALNHLDDAEDAFQATFLILAQKGETIRSSLASWLHGVALRTAKNLLREKAKRREREAQMPPRSEGQNEEQRDAQTILDREIAGLPDRYRLPVILCYLEGRTNDEAAEELGCSRGTIAGRLSRARELLRSRLQNRGASLSLAALTFLLTQQSAQSAPSTALLASTGEAILQPEPGAFLSPLVLRLAQKAMKDMMIAKPMMSLILTISLFLGGAYLLTHAQEIKKPPQKDKKVKVDKTKVRKQEWIQLAQLNGHKRRSEVWAVAFSPDGKTLISAGEDATVVAWDVNQRKMLWKSAPHQDEVVTLAISADGRRAITGGWDNMINVMSAKNGKLMIRIKMKARVESVAISPDGRFFASAGRDNVVSIFKGQTGQLLASMKGHTERILSLAFSPDGKFLASGSEDKTIRLWDVATQKPLPKPIPTGTDDMRGLAFTPNGRYLISSGDNDVLRIWDLKTKQAVQIPGHSRKIWSLAVDPTGAFAATGSADGSVRIWDIENRRQVGQISLDDKTTGLCFSPDGRTLATGTDKLVTLWRRKK